LVFQYRVLQSESVHSQPLRIGVASAPDDEPLDHQERIAFEKLMS
jgi:hypothetical protein